MLVLSRKVGEEVYIGDSIRVTVIEIRGSRVKLGFSGPDHVRFERSEIRLADPENEPAPSLCGQ